MGGGGGGGGGKCKKKNPSQQINQSSLLMLYRGATRGVMVSTSAFLAYQQCYRRRVVLLLARLLSWPATNARADAWSSG